MPFFKQFILQKTQVYAAFVIASKQTNSPRNFNMKENLKYWNAKEMTSQFPFYVRLSEENLKKKNILSQFFIENCPEFIAFEVKSNDTHDQYETEMKDFLFLFTCFEPWLCIEIEMNLRGFVESEVYCYNLGSGGIENKCVFPYVEFEIQSRFSGNNRLQTLFWRLTKAVKSKNGSNHRIWCEFLRKAQEYQESKIHMASSSTERHYLAGTGSFSIDIPQLIKQADGITREIDESFFTNSCDNFC